MVQKKTIDPVTEPINTPQTQSEPKTTNKPLILDVESVPDANQETLS